jgi:hypothetical protein
MAKIKLWWNQVVMAIKERKSNARAKALDDESKVVIQAREFDGEIYLSYKGVPLIKQEDMNYLLSEQLSRTRDAYKKYMENE